jgi:hypothetical protein
LRWSKATHWLVTVKQAAYVLIVKANQPTLHHQLAALPWRHIPAQDHTRDRGHQRVEIRHLQVATVPGLGFPHATQAIRITRRVRPLTGRKWRTVTAYHGAVLLRVGRDQLLLPEPLASLLQALPAHQPAGTAGRLPTRAAWLFPDRQPDRPIHPGQLRRRLGALGVACRANRTAALLQLATEVPAIVLADLLGVHPNTAERWVKLAAGNWTRYAAHAASDQLTHEHSRTVNI